MADKIVFISGANRGIGYELTQQLAKHPYKIIAGYRSINQSKQLLDEAENAKNIFPYKVDITAENDLTALHSFIATEFGQLDMLINNAAINQNRTLNLNDLDWSEIAHHFKVNVGGAFLSAKYLYPLIKAGKGKKIINISSRLASIDLSDGGSIPYSISKTGLNMLTKQQAIDYKADGIIVISLSPGWVRTDMGGSAAPLSPQKSAVRILQIIETLSLSQSGQFVESDGKILPY